MNNQPLPPFSFRQAAHDRLVERRSDRRFLDDAWGDPATRVLVARRHQLARDPDSGDLCRVAPDQAPPGERMLLGAVDGVTHFLVVAADRQDDGWDFAGLRDLAASLHDAHASLAVHAVSLAQWHQRHPMCSVCGAATEISAAGESRTCPSCLAVHFPRTDPAVIVLVIDDRGRCLLGHNSARVATWYSTLAGFVEPGESPEQAVVREVKEEAGIDVANVAYAGSQPWPFPSSLMLGFFAHATTTDINVDGEEITEARWFSPADLRREIEAGELVIPTTISIAGALITHWYGGELPRNRDRR